MAMKTHSNTDDHSYSIATILTIFHDPRLLRRHRAAHAKDPTEKAPMCDVFSVPTRGDPPQFAY